MKQFLLWSLAFLLSNQVSWADKIEYSKSYEICIVDSRGITVEMLDCMHVEMKSQDVKLNKNYKDLIQLIPLQRQKKLQEIQRSWMKYRDQNCNFYADPNSGTSASLNSTSCFLEMTASRAKELEWIKEYYIN